MQDEELLRYSRHILLPEIGIEGQERIRNGRVLQIGTGGLGSAAAMYLAAAGIGSLTLVDPDQVDLTNLQRQIAHCTAAVGSPKVHSAQKTLQQLNPHTQVYPLAHSADAHLLGSLVKQADVVLDCTDNFATRHAINAACVQHRVPLVSGAALQWDGQISVFDSRNGASPCYACAFPASAAVTEVACSTMGVFAPLVGIIGSMQAAEALKLLLGTAPAWSGRLVMLQAQTMEFTELQIQRNPACPVCGHGTTNLS